MYGMSITLHPALLQYSSRQSFTKEKAVRISFKDICKKISQSNGIMYNNNAACALQSILSNTRLERITDILCVHVLQLARHLERSSGLGLDLLKRNAFGQLRQSKAAVDAVNLENTLKAG